MGILIMSAIFTAQLLAFGSNSSAAVLGSVSVAIAVNAALCLASALAVGTFLRTRRPASTI